MRTLSQAPGKWPSEVENTRPRPSVKHHDSGKPKAGRTAPRAPRSSSASSTCEQDPGVGPQVAELVHLVVPAPRRAQVGEGRVVGLADLERDVLGPRMAVEAGADQQAVLVPAVAAVGRGVDGQHAGAPGPDAVEQRGALRPRTTASRRW